MANNKIVEKQKYTVSGQVVNANGEPIAGQEVLAMDVDLRGAAIYKTVLTLDEIKINQGFEHLGSTKTNTEGQYTIAFSSKDFSKNEIKLADVIVYAADDNRILGRSALATTDDYREDLVIENWNITLSDNAKRGLSEYTRLINALTPMVNDSGLILADLNRSQDQIDFLAQETGQNEARVTIAVQAAALAEVKNSTSSLSAELLYGVGRQNIPLQWSDLLAKTADSLANAIRQSIDENIIDDTDPQMILSAVNTISELAAKTANSDAQAALNKLIGISLPDAESQKKFIQRYAQFSGKPTDFWTALEKEDGIQPPTIQSLQFTNQLSLLTGQQTALVESLQINKQYQQLSDLLELTTDDWRKLVNASGVPDSVPGKSADEKSSFYIANMQNMLNAAFPTQRIGLLIKNNQLIFDDEKVKEYVGAFLTSTPTFDFSISRISEFGDQLKQISGDQHAPVMQQLQKIQRIYQVSPSPEIMSTLMFRGYGSAFQIAQIPQRSFIEQESAALGGTDLAFSVYNRAAHQVTQAKHTLLKLQDIFAQSISDKIVSKGQYQKIQQFVSQTVDWTTLFGAPQDCACDDCKSIFSPASYFVDIMQYLDNCKNSKGKIPLRVLFDRRPDLGDLLLTCENTNTEIPYIDLVNEVMEYYVAHSASSTIPFLAGDTGEATAAELRAEPQNTLMDAYFTIYSKAVYPFNLPYHQPLDVIRTYLAFLKSSRAELMEVFPLFTNASKTLESIPPGALDAERVKLSLNEYQILTNTGFDGSALAAVSAETFFGNPSPAYTNNAVSVSDLLQRTGMIYTDLISVLETRFINPGQHVYETLQALISSSALLPQTFYDELKSGTWNAASSQTNILLLIPAKISLTDFGTWIQTNTNGLNNFEHFQKLVTLYQASDGCDINKIFLHSIQWMYEGKPVADTGISENFLNNFHRFIRLWKKTGWSIHELDTILTALGKNEMSPDLIHDLGVILKITVLISLPLVQLSAFWGTLDIFGDNALYAQLFLKHTGSYQSKTPLPSNPFVPNPLNEIIVGTNLIQDFIPSICAALSISSEELAAVLADNGLATTTAILSLDNLSLLYRYRRLADALNISISDLCTLKSNCFGINPFDSVDHTLLFIQQVQEMKNSGFEAPVLNYILSGFLTDMDPAYLSEETVYAQLPGLWQTLASIKNDNPASDLSIISLDLMSKKLMLLYSKDVATRFISMLGGGDPPVFTALVPDPGFIIPVSLVSKYGYIQTNGQWFLQSNGMMTDIEYGQFLLTATGNMKSVIDFIYQAPYVFVKNTFAGLYQTENDLDTAVLNLFNLSRVNTSFVVPGSYTPLTTLDKKLSYFFKDFQPFLISQLQQNEVVSIFAALTALDAATTQSLLQPVMDKIIAAASETGLTATYFKDAVFATVGTTKNDPSVHFSWGTSAPDPSVPVDNFSIRWTGWISPPTDAIYTFTMQITETDETATLWVEGGKLIDINPPGTVNFLVSGQARLFLKAGKMVSVILEYTEKNNNAGIQLFWQSDSMPQSIVDSKYLFPATNTQFIDDQVRVFHRAAQFINGYKITPAEIIYFLANKGDFDNIDFTALTITHWLRLNRYTQLRRVIPAQKLIPIFQDAVTEFQKNATALPSDLLIQQLATAAGWNISYVRFLAGDAGDPLALPVIPASSSYYGLTVTDFKNENAYLLVKTALDLAKKTNMPISTTGLPAWVQIEMTPVANDNFNLIHQIAEQIKNAVKSRYTDSWLTIAGQLNDKIRENQKDALISYMLTLGLQLNGQPLADANALFEFLLIDVQMSPIVVTSRLIQATLAVQLFADRCLLGLEDEVAVSAINADEWEWLKHYSLEAGLKKLFVFVENYLEPSLRDDKSAFFEDFETALNKGDITDENAEAAFRTYLYDLNDAANLEISGMFDDTDTNTLHVFARNHAAPYNYYYRTRNAYERWTPWEKVQLDIKSIDDRDNSGVHLMPLVWKKRLFLFWPEFSPKTAKAPSSSTDFQTLSNESSNGGTAPKYWEIRFGWSEYANGKWTTKKLSKEAVSPFVDVWNAEYTNSITNFTIPQIPPHCYSFTMQVNATTQILTGYIQLGSEWLTGYLKGTDPQIAYTMTLPDITSKIVISNRNWYSSMFTLDEHIIHKTYLLSSHQESFFDDENYKSYQPFFERFRILKRGLSLAGIDFLKKPFNHQLLFSNDIECSVFQKSIQYPFFYSDMESDAVYYVTPVAVNKVLHIIFGLKDRVNATLNMTKYVATQTQNQKPVPGDPDPRYILDKEATQVDTSRSIIPKSGTVAGKQSPKYVSDVVQEIIPFAKQRYIPKRQPNIGLAFYTFYHPFVATYIKKLNQGGVAALLAADTTGFPNDPDFPNIDQNPLTPATDSGTTFARYLPDFSHVQEYNPSDPKRNYYLQNIDFSDFGTYSSYNWELFFHAPFLVATRLSKNGKYADARKWFHYIFNPLSTEAPYSASDSTSGFWQFLPFKNQASDDIIAYLNSLKAGYDIDPGSNSNPVNNQQVDQWRADPFNAFLIARNRPIAFMKNVVMAYLDNLIAWGDDLFKTYTRENINEATQLYIMAAHILGPQPQFIPARGTINPKSYNDLSNVLDDFGNAMVSFENTFPNSGEIQQVAGPLPPSILGIGNALYFCVPANDKLLQYWRTVADRLFKIRHGENIEGVFKSLALYEPPIDPALLLRARAQGLDIAGILADMESPAPIYRFTYLLAKAKEFCNHVVSFGNSVLAMSEKQDAEGLARLRQNQEVAMLGLVMDVKSRQVLEAQANLDTLYAARNTAIQRLSHFVEEMLGNPPAVIPEIPALADQVDENTSLPGESIIAPVVSSIDTSLTNADSGVKVIQKEKDEMGSLQTAFDFLTASSSSEALATVLNMFPVIKGHLTPLGVGIGTSFGGPQLGGAATSVAKVAQLISSLTSHSASQASKTSGFVRRQQDWVFQAEMASREIIQTDKQITAAQIRLQMAQHELDNHQVQMQNSNDIEQYLETKFTSQERYQWMLDKVKDVHKIGYQLAYDKGRMAEKAFGFELGITDSHFVQYGYFDDAYLGITAGDQLQLALNQMDAAYTDNNLREFELTKQVSLLSLDPAALMKLIETGSCQFAITEEIFDMDYPGHYFRRIKSVSISIPCVAGPYTTISSTLRLQQNSIRVNATLLTTGDGYAPDPSNPDVRFMHNNTPFTAIATSNAQNDSGVFELNFRDERYLPFEGAGVISNWQLELNGKFPKDGDPTTIIDLSQYNYRAIADILIQIKFSSREDAGDFRQNAINHLITYRTGNHFSRLLKLRQDFPNEFYAFINKPASTGAQTLNITLDPDRFPYFTKSGVVTIKQIELIADSTLLSKLSVPGPKDVNLLGDNIFGSLLHGVADFTSKPLLVSATQNLSLPLTFTPASPGDQLTYENLKELDMLIHYSIQ